MSIGGKLKMPAIPAESPPFIVTGTVKTISNGRYKNRGPMGRGRKPRAERERDDQEPPH